MSLRRGVMKRLVSLALKKYGWVPGIEGLSLLPLML